jgi:YD repeat-containing protein
VLFSTEQRFYTRTGLLHQIVDELGAATDTEYDAAGRAITVRGPQVDDGTGTQSRPVQETVYDSLGNVTAKIDPRGKRTDFEYDVRRRKTLERRPAVVDSLSGQTQRPELRWSYDGVGNVISVTDERGNLTRTTYDAAQRVVEVRAPAVVFGSSGLATGQPTTRTRYDANGNVLEVTDPNGFVTINTYDALNRLCTTTNGAGLTVRYDYDAVGNRTSVTDGNIHTTNLAYDGLNRLTTTTDAAGRVTTLFYDALNKVRRVDAAGQETQYAYDARNRLKEVAYVGRPEDQRRYRYDFPGKLLEVIEPGQAGRADVTYTYDALGRLLSETSAGLTHEYRYDLAGNRVRVTYAGGRVVVCTYDALNRLLTMVES